MEEPATKLWLQLTFSRTVKILVLWGQQLLPIKKKLKKNGGHQAGIRAVMSTTLGSPVLGCHIPKAGRTEISRPSGEHPVPVHSSPFGHSK